MVIEELKQKVNLLNSSEYENLVIAIFIDLFGRFFYPGPATKDGGRDGWCYGPLLLSSETMVKELEDIQKINYRWVFQVKHIAQDNLKSTMSEELKKAGQLIKLGYDAYILIVGFSIRNSRDFVFEEVETKFIDKGFKEFKILGLDEITQWLFKMDRIKNAYFPSTEITKKPVCFSPKTNSEKAICNLKNEDIIIEVDLQPAMNAIMSWKYENKLFHYIKLDYNGSIRKAIEAFQLKGYNEILIIEASSSQHELLLERINYLKIQSETVEEIKNMLLNYNIYITRKQNILWHHEIIKRNITSSFRIVPSITINAGKLERVKNELIRKIEYITGEKLEIYSESIIFNFHHSKIEVLFSDLTIKITSTTPIVLLNLTFEFKNNIHDLINSANTNEKIMEIGGNLFMMNNLIYNWVNIICIQFGYGIYNIQQIKTREVTR